MAAPLAVSNNRSLAHNTALDRPASALFDHLWQFSSRTRIYAMSSPEAPDQPNTWAVYVARLPSAQSERGRNWNLPTKRWTKQGR